MKALSLPVVFLLLITMVPVHAAEYFVDPINGSNANNGNSLGTPWQSIQFAVTQLAAGDTLYLREGTYHETGIGLSVSGAADAWITVRPWASESVSINGELAEFTQPNHNQWELVDAARHIYRSSQTYDLNNVYGYLGNSENHWRLVTYENYASFSTDIEYYNDSPPFYYVGPGLFYDAGQQRIYVRLQNSIYQQSMGLPFPSQTDPNQLVLHLFDDSPLIKLDGTAAYIRFSGLNVVYGGYAFELASGSHHIDLIDNTLIGGRYVVLVRDQVNSLTVSGNDFPGYVPPWIARSDVKRPSNGRPAHLLQGSAINFTATAWNVLITNNFFSNHFDAIDATKTVHDVHVVNNRFETIRDDVLQLGSGSWNIEVARNRMTTVAAGVSWNGSGSPSVQNRGKVYIHHNVIDSSVFQLYGRIDPNNQLEDKFDGPNGDGMATGRAFGMHSKSAIDGPAPWKIYHNTVVGSIDVDNRGSGASYYLADYDPNHPHEVYNNVFVQTWDSPVIRDARTADGSQIFDGNLYFRSTTNLTTPLFYRVFDVSGGNYQHFGQLADFIGSVSWATSQSYYPPGWESQGDENDPLLGSDYWPLNGSPALNGGVNLSGKSWPGTHGMTYRGAYGSTHADLIFTDVFE
jgi:hypothetical protein